MLLGLLARLTPLHVARSAGEREAIYRFRYGIYGQELHRDYPGIDHQRGLLKQDEDDAPETRLFYTGTLRRVTGTLRARVWDQLPPEVVEELSLQRLPRGLKVAYLERMMVPPTLRGRMLLPAMIWNGHAHLMAEGVEVCVLTCAPGLARHYLGMGARPYGARLVEGAASAEVPLAILMNDVEHVRRIRSFMLPQMRRLARPFDPAPFQPLFDPGAQAVIFEPAQVAAELAAARPPLFAGLGAAALRSIATRAYILQVEAGELVVRRGTADREMFLVLSGELEVESPARPHIRAGEPVGEMAFLGTPGLRTATVRATAPSRLLVLRRKFLDELAAVDLRAAYTLSRNLGRVAADRFAERAEVS
jgi:hypothetical protein